jgi:dTDP-4-amino-4,6-dideoxygalactose transaminase
MSVGPRDEFRGKIAESVDVAPEQVTLFAKGRVALYAILRALDVGPGDEVILPAFTCVAVPNAILYAGARPVYVDIDPASYTIDPSGVEAAVSPRTRVILAQNTFGLSADIDTLTAIAERHGLIVVDDCAHGMGGRYGGRPNGSSAPLSFFSTQWSKPISTGLGGVAIAHDGPTADRLRRLENAAFEPSALRVAALRVLVAGAERAGHGRLFRTGRSAYRVTSRLGLVPGSSDRQELGGIEMPDGFLAGLSEWQARRGAERIERLAEDIHLRRSIAGRYTAWLIDHDRTPAVEVGGASHSFLRYPLRVMDKAAFVTAADRRGIDLGDWFVSPLHPVTTGLERWGYVRGTAPIAEAACSEIVNLPTDPKLSERDVADVLRFLAASIAHIR